MQRLKPARPPRPRPLVDNLDLFNLNPTITFNNTYGSRWQNPFTILPGRFAKFGLQLDF